MFEIVLMIIGAIISAVVGAYLEHKLKMWSILRKLYYFAINSQTSLKIYFKLTSDEEIHQNDIKHIFHKTDKQGRWKILKEDTNTVVYSDDELNLDFFVMPDNTLMVQTSRISKPIRGLSTEFEAICNIIDSFSKLSKYAVINCSFEVHLPYQRDMLKFYFPKHYELQDYKIELKDRDFNSELKINDKVISSADSEISKMKTAFHRLLSPY